MRFLTLSDAHSAHLPSTLPACNILLHCGDTTEDGPPPSISKALQSLGQIDAELKLMIAGNHEISLDKAYYISEGRSLEDVDSARAMTFRSPDSGASNNGIMYLREGTHIFTLSSGAAFTIYASLYTPAYGTSAFQYPSREDRFNTAEITTPWGTNTSTDASWIPDSVDIVMTHGPAKHVLDSTHGGRSAETGVQGWGEHGRGGGLHRAVCEGVGGEEPGGEEGVREVTA